MHDRIGHMVHPLGPGTRPPQTRYPQDQAPPWDQAQPSWSRHPPGLGIPHGTRLPQDQAPSHKVSVRAVGILLECILVIAANGLYGIQCKYSHGATVRVHLYKKEGESERDIASNMLHCFLSMCLYYSDNSSDKDQRKWTLTVTLNPT